MSTRRWSTALERRRIMRLTLYAYAARSTQYDDSSSSSSSSCTDSSSSSSENDMFVDEIDLALQCVLCRGNIPLQPQDMLLR